MTQTGRRSEADSDRRPVFVFISARFLLPHHPPGGSIPPTRRDDPIVLAPFFCPVSGKPAGCIWGGIAVPTVPPDTEELLDRTGAGDRERARSAAGAAPRAAAADDRPAHRPPSGRAPRPVRRGAGRSRRGEPASGRLRSHPALAVLPVAAPAGLGPAGRPAPPARPIRPAERHAGGGGVLGPVGRVGRRTGRTAPAPRTKAPARRCGGTKLRDRVRAALAAMPVQDREVLVLRYLEGLTARDVGAVLGIAEAAAKKRGLAALGRLRDLLKDHGAGGRVMSKVDEGGRPASDSSALADLIDRLTARMQAGEAIDWEEEARQHPERAGELLRLRPALGGAGRLVPIRPGGAFGRGRVAGGWPMVRRRACWATSASSARSAAAAWAWCTRRSRCRWAGGWR